MKRYISILMAMVLAFSAGCPAPPAPPPDQKAGNALSGFPTAAAPNLSYGETVGPNIATALLVFSTQVINDLTTLNNIAPLGNKARCVITALPGAYTGSGTGVLTASGNGAITSGQCGTVTTVATDVVFLAAGATNISAAKDAGPYTLTQQGTGGLPYKLARPAWWSHGSVIPVGTFVSIGGEDAVFGGSEWYSYSAKGTVIDTTDPSTYPDFVALQVTLVNGVAAIANIPLRSATLSAVHCDYAGSGTPNAATLSYQSGAITPGALGTASVSAFSAKAAMAAQNTDTSVVNCLLSN